MSVHLEKRYPELS